MVSAYMRWVEDNDLEMDGVVAMNMDMSKAPRQVRLGKVFFEHLYGEDEEGNVTNCKMSFYSGVQTPTAREEVKAQAKKGAYRLLLLTIKSAGTGLNFQVTGHSLLSALSLTSFVLGI